MNITSSKQLEQVLMAKYEAAIAGARDEIYDIIDSFLKDFYFEFEPSVYKRTRQLLRSLVKTDVKRVGNRVEASVYFDLDTLDYSMKIVTDNFPWATEAERDAGEKVNTYHRQSWSHENDIAVFEMAAHGSHGGAVKGTAIWDKPHAIINSRWRNILKEMLLKQGISIR